MSRNFEVEMAVYAWDEVFQVTSLLKEGNLWTNTFNTEEAMKIFPFAVTEALEMKDGVCPQEVADILWPTTPWLMPFANSVLRLIYETDEKVRQKLTENEWNTSFIITWVQEITIH